MVVAGFRRVVSIPRLLFQGRPAVFRLQPDSVPELLCLVTFNFNFGKGQRAFRKKAVRKPKGSTTVTLIPNSFKSRASTSENAMTAAYPKPFDAPIINHTFWAFIT